MESAGSNNAGGGNVGTSGTAGGNAAGKTVGGGNEAQPQGGFNLNKKANPASQGAHPGGA
jgi:hypothetical protein